MDRTVSGSFRNSRSSCLSSWPLLILCFGPRLKSFCPPFMLRQTDSKSFVPQQLKTLRHHWNKKQTQDNVPAVRDRLISLVPRLGRGWTLSPGAAPSVPARGLTETAEGVQTRNKLHHQADKDGDTVTVVKLSPLQPRCPRVMWTKGK